MEKRTELGGEVETRRLVEIALPTDLLHFEEANLPSDLAAALAGRAVIVEVLAEEMPGTRRAEPGENPVFIDPEGNYVNDYNPVRVRYTDDKGCVWLLPRHWLAGSIGCTAPQPDSQYRVTREHVFTEEIHLPSHWDLVEINIPSGQASRAGGSPTFAQVHLGPDAPVRVFWTDAQGERWRIPHTWRRRRVRLPATEILTAQCVPPDVAEVYAGRVVSVNYHPGSLCCLPEHYRFRDGQGNRWPVRIQDCFLLGYGDAEEHLA